MRIFLVLFLTSLLRCPAQQVSTLHFGLDVGLLSTEIYDLFQDRDGFIWIASDNGVARYDGNKVTTFQAGDGLTDPVVFGISQDSKGRIWFRTFSGQVSYFEKGVIKPYKYNDLIVPYCKESLLQSFCIDANDNVWFGTGEVFGRINNFGLPEIQKLKNRVIECAIVKDEVVFGYPWPHQYIDAVSIRNKIYSIDLSDKINHILNVPILKLAESLILGLGKDIFEYKNGKIDRLFSGKDIIISLSKDRDGNVWAGFMKAGVIKLPASDLKAYETVNFLNDKSVTKVLKDHQGGYWFSTLENGVYRIPDFDILFCETPALSKIKSVAADRNRAYVGLEDGSVFSVNKDFQIKNIRKGGFPTLAMVTDSRSRIWVSSTMDTELFDSLGHTLAMYPISHNDIFENREGVWGISRTRIIHYSNNELGYNNFPIAYLYRSISGYDTTVVLAGRIGIDVYDRKVLKKTRGPLFQTHKLSRVIDLNDSLVVLLSVGSGFFVLDKQTLGQRFSFNVKLMGDNIYSAIKVDSVMWLGTEQGIAITPIQSLISKIPTFERLTNRNGLIKNKISFLKNIDSKIYAFSENTFYSIPKNKTFKNKPTFYLESIKVNNKRISQDSLTQLAFTQNNLQVSFGFISFNNQNIYVRSRLSKGSIWSYTRAREFSYNALQPGKYDLEIEYSIDNYRWYPASQEIIFSIAEPWWQNKILQLSIFCIVIAMVYFFLKNQIEVLKQRQKMMEANARFQEDLLRAEHAAMENERSRIAKDLHDGVGTALAVIKISIYSQLKDIVEKRVVLNEQLDVVIQDIREIIYDLAPHGIDRDGLRTSIENYIDRVKSKATYFQIDFRFSGEESVDLKIAISIFRIVQELITNTLKHSAATRISVIISSQKENLILTYRDNGIGLTLSKKKNGYGLGNIESRVSSMNGKIILLPSDSGVHYEITIPIYHNSMQRTS